MYRQPRKQFSPQQESLDVWQRLTQLLLLAVFVGIAILTMSFFAPQVEKQRSMEAENLELAAIRDDLQRQLDQRHNQQRLLRTDPEYFEQFARDKLDLQRDGETIIRIDRSSGKPRISDYE
jgi:cell division protein FtsB